MYIKGKNFFLLSLSSFCALGIFLLCIFTFEYSTISLRTQPLMYNEINAVPEAQTALLLGARVYPSGRLSDIMRDRALIAIELYNAGKVEKILVSADHGQKEYDEVNAIKNFLLENNIPKEVIYLDHAGFDTYDSVTRAKDIFEVKSMTIVTQEFHLPRALYIAKKKNIPVYGMIADKQHYQDAQKYTFREYLARVKAVLEIMFGAKPKYLGEPVPLSESSNASWD